MRIDNETTFEEFAENPEKYGFVSFETFKKNYKKMMDWKSETAKLSMISNGPVHLRPMLKDHEIFVNGYKCDTEEKAEQVAKSENIDLTCVSRQEAVDIGNGKLIMRFYFDKKKEPRNGLIIPPY